MSSQSGPSFVQLFTIAAVLALSAKIIVPQFSSADTEKKVIVLIDALETVRSHLDLYRVGGNHSFAAVDSPSDFAAAITLPSDEYKPAIRRMPVNPFNGLNTVRIDGEPAGAGKAGWRFDTKTIRFQADNDPGYTDL